MISSQVFKSISYAILLVMAFTHADAQETIVGLWGFDGCDNAEEIEYQGYSVAAFSGDKRIEVIAQEITPIRESKWVFARVDNLDPAPALMRVKDGILEQAWTNTDPETEAETKTLHDSLSTGSLSPETAPEAFDVLRAETCTSLPLPQSLIMGEALAVLQAIDAAAWSCRDAFNDCPHKMFDVADISGDGELSVAEMARMFRASVSIVTAMDSDVASNQSIVAATGSAAIAPVASAALLYSFDYDRSGSLSFDELLLERLPDEYSGPKSGELDVSGWLGTISEVAKTAATAGATLFP